MCVSHALRLAGEGAGAGAENLGASYFHRAADSAASQRQAHSIGDERVSLRQCWVRKRVVSSASHDPVAWRWD